MKSFAPALITSTYLYPSEKPVIDIMLTSGKFARTFSINSIPSISGIFMSVNRKVYSCFSRIFKASGPLSAVLAEKPSVETSS